MLAQFYILLPFEMQMPQGFAVDPIEFDKDGYQIRVYPPHQACGAISYAPNRVQRPANELVREMLPPDAPQPAGPITIDGEQAFSGSVLRVDFRKADFDRRIEQELQPLQIDAYLRRGDPPLKLAIDIVNSVLRRLKGVGHSPHIGTIEPMDSFYWFRYLSDDEGELPLDPALHRNRFSKTFSFELTAITRGIWERMRALPFDHAPPIWEEVLLDAEAIRKEPGPCIVLLHTALESFISISMKALAARDERLTKMWAWLSDDERRDKRPSTRDMYGDLLAAVLGRSLKEERELWNALIDLRKIRNSYVHEGKLELNGRRVTALDALQLLVRTKQIIEWLERELPPELRRLPVENAQVVFDIPIALPVG